MSRRRIVSALAAAALAATMLAGCRSDVGVAARVNGSTITESDVNHYVDPKGAPSGSAGQSGQNASARTVIVSLLVQEQVYEQTLRHLGVRPSDGQLNAEHDAAASLLLQTQLSGGALDRAVEQQVLKKFGVRSSLRATFLRVYEYEYLLVQRAKLKQFGELVALVKKAGVRVSVSPRYGTWDEANLQVAGTSPLPSFVSAQPAAAGS